MKLKDKIQKILSDEFIIRTNELYHDLENALYQNRHKYMFSLEKERWDQIGKKFVDGRKESLTILDYGTGAGFVPITLKSYLKEEDKLICMDVSSEILKVCEENLAEVKCQKLFLKTDGKSFDIAPSSVDIITINSVLHHLPDINTFSQNCGKVLKPKGILAIIHEPHRNEPLPFKNKILVSLIKFGNNPLEIFYKLTSVFSFLEVILRPIVGTFSNSYRERNKMLKKISLQLQEEGWIDFSLRGTEIQQIVDIHTEKKFSRLEINKFFSSEDHWKIFEWETFNLIESSNSQIKAFERKLLQNNPNSGHTLRFIVEKTEK